MRGFVASVCAQRLVAFFLMLSIAIAALPLACADASGKPKPLQIGLAKSFFTERPKTFVDIATDDFKEVIKKTTGLNGELISKYEASEVAEKLNSRQVDFGILHAHEFAWMQKKYPDLRPLMIAANNHHVERAYVIVHQNSPAKTIADLRSKKLDMSVETKEHSRLFLERRCTDKAQNGLAAFFGSIEKSPTQADALDEVARGKVQAAVVDTMALEFYKEIKGPVFAKNLKVLEQSEVFPPAVIVYNQGVLAEATVNQFRDGLLKAHTTDVGRNLMKTWQFDAFEPTPKDYTKRLAELLKNYPPPASQR